ncbi:MAG: hypothetical protein ACTSPI_00505 [Candidatus Heimdallarchaeaceae archaeon]
MDKKKRIKINKIRKEIVKQRKLLSHNSKVLNEFKKFEFSKKFRIYLNPTYIYIYIDIYKDLHELRSELRKNFGSWKDTCVNISSYWSNFNKDYRVTYLWKGQYKSMPITISLELFYKEIPEELKSLKENCKFRETVKTTKEEVTTRKLEYICNV